MFSPPTRRNIRSFGGETILYISERALEQHHECSVCLEACATQRPPALAAPCLANVGPRGRSCGGRQLAPSSGQTSYAPRRRGGDEVARSGRDLWRGRERGAGESEVFTLLWPPRRRGDAEEMRNTADDVMTIGRASAGREGTRACRIRAKKRSRFEARPHDFDTVLSGPRIFSEGGTFLEERSGALSILPRNHNTVLSCSSVGVACHLASCQCTVEMLGALC
jgi:hypothetical protein